MRDFGKYQQECHLLVTGYQSNMMASDFTLTFKTAVCTKTKSNLCHNVISMFIGKIVQTEKIQIQSPLKFSKTSVCAKVLQQSRGKSVEAWCCNTLGSVKVSGKLLTYPSPKPTFCLKWEVSDNVGLGEGEVGSFLETQNVWINNYWSTHCCGAIPQSWISGAPF